MSNIIIFRSGQTPQYIMSVNTPEYIDDLDVIINPDISSVTSVPIQYWKRVGDAVSEMTTEEKQAIVATALAQRKSSADTFGVEMVTALTALIKVINVRLPAGQKITTAEMITALKAEIT